LRALLSLRALRVEAADKAVKFAEQALGEALAEAERRETILERWRIVMAEETERRWAALLGTKKTLEQLDDFRAGLGELVRREMALAQDAADAREIVEKRRTELTEAKEARLACLRAKVKMERHRDLWLAEELKEEERLEGLELEEFTRPSATPAE
jgi:type III secretion protein O